MAKKNDDKGNASATDDTQQGTQDEPLGDAGKKALEAERKARKEAEQQAKAARDDLLRTRRCCPMSGSSLGPT